MQKLNMIEAFVELPEGTQATFYHPEGQAEQARLIKMKVNAPAAANLYITPLDKVNPETGELIDGESLFLAHVVPGCDQIEFFYRGTFALATLGGSIWLDTYDNTSFSVEASDFTSYARLWEREERDPRILEIEQMARHNQRLLLEQMAADRAEYQVRMRELDERLNNVPPAAVVASGGTASPEPVVSSGASAGDPAATAPAAAGTGGEPNVVA